MAGVKPGEHPLMSHKTLRTMFTSMVKARVLLGRMRAGRGQRAALADVACWASTVVGLEDGDLSLGCREDGVLEGMRETASVAIAGGVERLYAGVGAALRIKKGRVVMVFVERHEAGGRGWDEALRVAAELPVIVVVLPRWKGVETDGDLCKEARLVGVPGIAVDGQDAKAIYRVAQESLGRARADGGCALIEAVTLPDGGDAIAGLAESLVARKVASKAWIDGVEKKFVAQLNRGAE
jgi:hypothetical protein